jgi:hypothetical protein
MAILCVKPLTLKPDKDISLHFSQTELARSLHHLQLIIQLSWMQLSTVMV